MSKKVRPNYEWRKRHQSAPEAVESAPEAVESAPVAKKSSPKSNPQKSE